MLKFTYMPRTLTWLCMIIRENFWIVLWSYVRIRTFIVYDKVDCNAYSIYIIAQRYIRWTYECIRSSGTSHLITHHPIGSYLNLCNCAPSYKPVSPVKFCVLTKWANGLLFGISLSSTAWTWNSNKKSTKGANVSSSAHLHESAFIQAFFFYSCKSQDYDKRESYVTR